MNRTIPLIAVCFLTGCEAVDRIPVHPLEGGLEVRGKPAAGAQLTFHKIGARAAGEAIPFAVVEPDGKFRATTFEPGDGAPEGEYRVGVVWPRPGVQSDDGNAAPDQLNGRFASPTKSPLRAVVTPGGVKLENFRLD